jgi:hypothetical protein
MRSPFADPSHGSLTHETTGRAALSARYGNIFSLDVGPDYKGEIRAIDARTLAAVGEMIRNGAVR